MVLYLRGDKFLGRDLFKEFVIFFYGQICQRCAGEVRKVKKK